MAKNLKVLDKIDGIELIWDFTEAKNILNEHVKKTNEKKVEVYQKLAVLINLSEGAVKNWFTVKNGPGDIDLVKDIAKFFDKDYSEFLTPLSDAKNESGMLEMDITDDCQFGGGFMFDYKTIRFIDMLNQLAEASKLGFIPFSQYTEEKDKEPFAGIIYIDEEGSDYGKIILDMCVDRNHHDWISTYNDYVDGIQYHARVINEDGEFFIDVTGEQNMCIAIENGRWYCC